MGDNKGVLKQLWKVPQVDYFKLLAYTSFLFAIISLVGTVLYYADQWLDPEEDDTPSGRHL